MARLEIKYNTSKGLIANLASLSQAADKFIKFRGEVQPKTWQDIGNSISASMVSAYLTNQPPITDSTKKKKSQQLGQKLRRGLVSPGSATAEVVSTPGIQTGFLLGHIASPSQYPSKGSRYKTQVARDSKHKNFSKNKFFWRLNTEIFEWEGSGDKTYPLTRPPFTTSKEAPEVIVEVRPNGIFLTSSTKAVISKSQWDFIRTLLRNQTFVKQFTETFGKMK